MPTYISLITFTDLGVEKFRDTRKRAKAFEATAKSLNAEVRRVYWTLGAYDGVLIVDAPDDEAATALMLMLASEGFVRPETMRAFEADEIESILARTRPGKRG